MKNQAMVYKCIKMAMCILEISHKIKNMAKVHCFGSIYAKTRKRTKLNNIMEIGGEAYPMVKANTRKPTETSMWEVLRMD